MAGEAFGLVGACGLDVLGWHTTPKFVGSYLCVLQHEGTRCHYGSFAYDAMVEQRGTHANECIVTNSAAMNYSIMTNSAVLSYGGIFMENTVVLNVRSVPHNYLSVISPKYRSEPD